VIDIDANFDLTEVDRAMADVEARAKRLAPAFRELRRPLRTDQRAHARAEEGPDGRWPPRSPFTEARRQVRNRAVRVHRFDVLRRGEGRRRSTPKQVAPIRGDVTLGPARRDAAAVARYQVELEGQAAAAGVRGAAVAQLTRDVDQLRASIQKLIGLRTTL
jgi:hypothetical protein